MPNRSSPEVRLRISMGHVPSAGMAIIGVTMSCKLILDVSILLVSSRSRRAGTLQSNTVMLFQKTWLSYPDRNQASIKFINYLSQTPLISSQSPPAPATFPSYPPAENHSAYKSPPQSAHSIVLMHTPHMSCPCSYR